MLYTGDFVLRYYVGFSQIRSHIYCLYTKKIGMEFNLADWQLAKYANFIAPNFCLAGRAITLNLSIFRRAVC